MNDLRSFAGLQARVYEFLEKQDEATLQAIIRGSAELTVLHGEDAGIPAGAAPREEVRIAPRPPSVGLTTMPSGDPLQAAQELLRLTSEPERRLYLNAAKLRMNELRKVAKLLGLTGYSRFTQAKLMNLLSGDGPDHTARPADGPKTSAPTSPDPADNNSQAAEEVTPQESPPPAAPVQPNADAAAIALRLRETETEEEGAAYLDALRLDRESLLAVAAELQLTRVERLSQKELRRRVLKQAIGARRKFAGLRNW